MSSAVAAVDLLVVGSGPAGAAVARSALDRSPHLTVLMVERGPLLETLVGQNVRSAEPELRERVLARLGAADAPGLDRLEREAGEPLVRPRPGTHAVRLLPADADPQLGMPGALYAENVGGMGAFWTCATPRPRDSERGDLIPSAELDTALMEAEALLDVSTTAYPRTDAGEALLERLSDAFDGPTSTVAAMPLAAAPGRRPGHPAWSGPRAILGEFADAGLQPGGRFRLLPGTAAVRIGREGAEATHVRLRDMATGVEWEVAVGAVVVAADALRTPQLLWASGIRPSALGRHLNDQPQVVAAAFLDAGPAPVGRASDTGEATETFDAEADHPFHGTPSGGQDTVTGVLWLPFDDAAGRPFHTQIMQMDASPIAIGEVATRDGRPVVGIGVFAAKDLQAEDRVHFDETAPDEAGLPGIRIDYALTTEDHRRIAAATELARRVADAIGETAPGGEPVLLPAGSSIHYQGTVRMGAADDGASVCDAHGRVWGTSNVFVAGNGVIATATGCNQTLTGVALAVRTGAEAARVAAAARG